ncbi:MFS transporter [Lentibacillus sp. N15]|uniref:CynX/NimT family MFS transporter n=1 Tax=Lentibacillus songyuanensis TaxID=3136161 RepID=UPI0031BBA9C7
MEKCIVSDENQNKLASWLLLIGIILIASNLRAPLTSVGSLLSSIRDDLAISNTLAGALTTLPLLAFAILSPFVSVIANRVGMERTIFYSFILLTTGLVIRSLFGVTFLFSGTVIVGIAIAFGNVLLPGLIKMKFPFKIGLMTGLYAVFMNLFGALASGISLPLSRISGFGWKGSLACWGFFSIIALLVWISQLKSKADSPKVQSRSEVVNNNVWKSSLAWNITVYMGTQSMVFYTMVSWLPEILKDNGYTSDVAGWMLSLMQFAFIPFTFIVPVIAEKTADQRLLTGITGVLVIIGAIGLFSGNTVFITIAVICIGSACGAAFSLSMMFFSLRSKDGQEASKVSGMAQSFGYLIAAAGPILLGAMHDITAGWFLPLATVGIVGIILIGTGMKAGADRKIASAR